MKVPSGATLTELDLNIINKMAEVRFIRMHGEPQRLVGGATSNLYVHGREDFTDNPDLGELIGLKLCDVLQNAVPKSNKQLCVIGVPTAATALAQAISSISYYHGKWINGRPIGYRIMRELPKDHGAHMHYVNGDAEADGQTYWLVENVITMGTSLLGAAKKLSESQYPRAEGTVILIDRQQGGLENLTAAGFTNLVVVYKLLDILFAFGRLNLWNKEDVEAAAREISHKPIFIN